LDIHSNYLGELLIRNKLINRDQLEKALEVQEQRDNMGEKTYLGNIIKELGYCDDEAIAKVLAQKHNVPYVDVEGLDIDEDIIRMIPRSTANRYKVFPVKLEQNKLMVAMMHPEDVMAIDDLRMITGKEVQPVLIKDSELEILIKKVSKKYSGGIEGFEFFKIAKEKAVRGKKEQLVLEPGKVSSAPPVELLNKLLDLAINERVNDLHIEPRKNEVKIRFRIDGVLHDRLTIAYDYYYSLVTRIKVLSDMDIADSRTPQDGRMSIDRNGELIDVRTASLPAYYGERVTLRLLFHEPALMNLENLGFNREQLASFKELIRYPYGFVLVAGPTGSGKSTTLYAGMNEINTENKNIITIEDPVEKKLEGINQVQYNKKAGITFTRGLRSMLRSHPDVIMVGEIRDSDTGVMATEASLTGHLVLSTIHASDSAKGVIHLLDMGVKPYLVESSLTGVLSQRLLRKLCHNCKAVYKVRNDELLAMLPDFPVDHSTGVSELYRSRGCAVCDQTGYSGRTGVFEILVITDSIREAMRKEQSSYAIRKLAIAEGMSTLRQNGLEKVKNAITSIEEFRRVFVT